MSKKWKWAFSAKICDSVAAAVVAKYADNTVVVKPFKQRAENERRD